MHKEKENKKNWPNQHSKKTTIKINNNKRKVLLKIKMMMNQNVSIKTRKLIVRTNLLSSNIYKLKKELKFKQNNNKISEIKQIVNISLKCFKIGCKLYFISPKYKKK